MRKIELEKLVAEINFDKNDLTNQDLFLLLRNKFSLNISSATIATAEIYKIKVSEARKIVVESGLWDEEQLQNLKFSTKDFFDTIDQGN